MAGPLGVSHLLLFSRSNSGNTNLRIALAPRGPTLHFRVEKYSLSKDIKKALKHPHGGGKEFTSPPLVRQRPTSFILSLANQLQLVMNHFTTSKASEDSTAVPKHLEQLTTSVFQSLFPPISPQTTPLSSIRRVLLLNRELDQSGSTEASYIINLRHFAITTKRVGLSKGIKRLNAAEKLGKSREKRKHGVPNLGKLGDVADYLLDPFANGYTSASETEVETDAEIEILESSTRKVLNPKQRAQRRAQAAKEATSQAKEQSNVERRAVKLIELGPRMRLRLMKVEEGVCTGKVMWHEYLRKTAAEAHELDEIWKTRKKEKERRKAEQRANIERKRGQSGGDNAEANMMDDEDEWDSEGLEGAGELEAEEDTEMQSTELHEVPAG